jgi:protein ImuB
VAPPPSLPPSSLPPPTPTPAPTPASPGACWIALHLPALPLEAWAATLPPAAAAGPLALESEHRLVAVNAAAAALGVQPGQRRATALALAPALVLGAPDAAREAQAAWAVAHAALAFTPAVTLEGRDIVLLEVRSTLRYFGGHARLLGRLRRALAPLGHRLQIASAGTALGAALLARWRADLAEGPHVADPEALHTLLDAAPAALLDAQAAATEAWTAMGLHTLGDLRALPRAGVARRFGDDLLETLDRARGQRPDPRRWCVLPPRFLAEVELHHRADDAAQLQHAAGLLLARLLAWASAQQARVAAFTLEMPHERHRAQADEAPITVLRVELAEPSADLRHLQAVLKERLNRLALPAPTLGLRLRCDELRHQPAPHAELFPTRQSEHEGLGRLLERLRARLGDGQVGWLQPVADHRPERGAPAGLQPKPPAAWPAGATAVPQPFMRSTVETIHVQKDWPLHRPLWLHPEPIPLPQRGARPCWQGRALHLLAGPERLETGWWDGALATRDYFMARTDDGALLWVYRARWVGAIDDGAREGGWFLQGQFG